MQRFLKSMSAVHAVAEYHEKVTWVCAESYGAEIYDE